MKIWTRDSAKGYWLEDSFVLRWIRFPSLALCIPPMTSTIWSISSITTIETIGPCNTAFDHTRLDPAATQKGAMD